MQRGRLHPGQLAVPDTRKDQPALQPPAHLLDGWVLDPQPAHLLLEEGVLVFLDDLVAEGERDDPLKMRQANRTEDLLPGGCRNAVEAEFSPALPGWPACGRRRAGRRRAGALSGRWSSVAPALGPTWGTCLVARRA